MKTNKLIKIEIPQQVKVRKYEVDTESLKALLRDSKIKSKLSNKQIADRLGQPLTLVEHWFKKDNSFAIPNEVIWLDFKKLLCIETDKFDKSILSFEIKDGVYEKSNRVYDSNGLCPTLTAEGSEFEKILIIK